MANPQVNKIQIALPDKLDGKNWNIWKKCMMNAFFLHGLKIVLEDGFTVEFQKDSTTEFTPGTKTKLNNDIMAQNIILTNIINSLSVVVDGCSNANDMWKALLNQFEGSN